MKGKTEGAMVEAENLTKRFGDVKALDGVTLGVEAGEWVSIKGPSGSGKTTLLNLVAGLDTPTSGSVEVAGERVSELSQEERATFRRENVGIVFQQFHLIPYLTALENVMMAQYLHSVPDEDEAFDALKRVGLGERGDHRPSQLSGGEQQRVSIARAIINEPKVLLADEPTGNLDRKNERIVLGTFESLQDDGMTILGVTHNPEVAEPGDRVVEIHHGELLK